MDNVQKAKNAKIVSVFIYSKVDKKILKKLPNVKLITTRSTGYDHIATKACKKKGISVSNVPSYGSNTVAEHTFALILGLSRKLWTAHSNLQKDKFTIDNLRGFDLHGKTIGVIGAGKIGLHVITIARAFGMHVLTTCADPIEEVAELLDFEYVELDELLKKSDIVSLHVPLTRSTKHMINKKTLKQMKKGALLINTARGGIINTRDMIDALESKRLGGVGIDVIEGEAKIKEEKQMLHEEDKREKLSLLAKEKELFGRDNVIFTPHVAFYSEEAITRILSTTVNNIDAFTQKRKVNWVV